jgi:hypothetical protein
MIEIPLPELPHERMQWIIGCSLKGSRKPPHMDQKTAPSDDSRGGGLSYRAISVPSGLAAIV